VGLLARLSTIIKAKISNLLEGAEDPREILDYSYQKQLELLQQVKRGLADVVTSRKRLEMQKTRLQESGQKLDSQAREALSAGREDLARQAVERKVALQGQLNSLDGQIGDLKKEEERLQTAERKLSAKIESFRATKETIKAQYTAAEAQVKINEAASGISEEMADVGLAVDRAQEKTETMKARAGALDELIESGTFEEYGVAKDEIQRELDQVSAQKDVEAQLETLKREVRTAG